MNKPQWDQIHIRDLTVRCIVGVNPDERNNKQDINIHITLYTDLRQAGSSDDLKDTVDYKAVKQNVYQAVEASSDLLIERLAERIAHICLFYEKVEAVRVVLEKPGALRFAKTVAVEIYREQSAHE